MRAAASRDPRRGAVAEGVSENTATLHAGIAVVLAVVFVLIQIGWRRTLVSWAVVPVFLAVAFHPRWSLSVMNGDCGMASADWSVWITVALAAAITVQATRWTLARGAGRAVEAAV